MMHLSRTELRTATDAASKAAAATLAQSLDTDMAITRGQQIAAANTVNGDPLLLDRSDFTFGRSDELGLGKIRVFRGWPADETVCCRRAANGRFTIRSGPAVLWQSSLASSSLSRSNQRHGDVHRTRHRFGCRPQRLDGGQKFADLVNAIDTFTATLDETPVDEQVGLASYSEFATEDVQLTDNLAADHRRHGSTAGRRIHEHLARHGSGQKRDGSEQVAARNLSNAP